MLFIAFAIFYTRLLDKGVHVSPRESDRFYAVCYSDTIAGIFTIIIIFAIFIIIIIMSPSS
jgi:hypothetical protein